jgi:hypothetical protein
MIYIFDFEDGLQEILSYAIEQPTKTMYWDRKGFFSEIEISKNDKNIFIMSKPYDCLHRGVLKNKYKETDERLLKDWSRRNWRYSNPEMYEHINSIIESTDDFLIIHPDDFKSLEIKSKIKKYTGSDIKLSDQKLREIYKENVNIS